MKIPLNWSVSIIIGWLVGVESEDPCSSDVGHCYIDKTCVSGASCENDRCVCHLAACAIDGKCVSRPHRDLKPRQPSLDKADWFLTATEIEESRGGLPRSSNISVQSSGNLVKPICGGQAYFAELYDVLTTLDKGDSVHIASWLMGTEFQLRPELDLAGTANTTLGKVLADAAHRNVEVLLLLHRNIIPRNEFSQLKEVQRSIDVVLEAAKARSAPESRVEAYMDGRIPKSGSIHQKFIVIKKAEKAFPMAWAGGLEVTEMRWDVMGSNTSYPPATTDVGKQEQDRTSLLRTKEAGNSPVNNANAHGWHDTTFAIEGPAAGDIAVSFAERWNEQACDLTDFPTIQHPLTPIPVPSLASSGPKIGTQAVQVLRTYGCTYAHSSGCYKSFAANGETTIHASFMKAIKAAQAFIYIEDQYFYWVEEVHFALRDALRTRIAHLILLIQIPEEVPGSDTWLWNFWYPLYQEFPDQVHGFYRKGDVYIHSKTKVIDDVYSMVGSPNINYRSHTSDAELASAVVDEGEIVQTPDDLNVTKWARDWRLLLWESNTGVPMSEWERMTLDESIKKWYEVAAAENSRIGMFNFSYSGDSSTNIPEYEAWSDNDIMREAIDPDGRCSSLHVTSFDAVHDTEGELVI